jgi:peptidoglycan hydrolase-like protein with peptidoglycan-binding domain
VTPEQVADAQRRLGVRVSGVVDDELWAAVRRFQMGAGLLVTGELDQATYRRLWQTRLLRSPGRQTGDASEPGLETDVTTRP